MGGGERWEEVRGGRREEVGGGERGGRERRWVPVRYPVRGQVTTDRIIITTVVLVLGWTDRQTDAWTSE